MFNFDYDKSIGKNQISNNILIPALRDMGYDTFNYILNIGGVYIFIILFIFSFFILFLLWIVQACLESSITGKEIKWYAAAVKSRSTRFYKFKRTVKFHYKLKAFCDSVMNNLFLAGPILLA